MTTGAMNPQLLADSGYVVVDQYYSKRSYKAATATWSESLYRGNSISSGSIDTRKCCLDYTRIYLQDLTHCA